MPVLFRIGKILLELSDARQYKCLHGPVGPQQVVQDQMMTALYLHPTASLVRWRGLRDLLRVGLSACIKLNGGAFFLHFSKLH